jgi:hypothetical protein
VALIPGAIGDGGVLLEIVDWVDGFGRTVPRGN